MSTANALQAPVTYSFEIDRDTLESERSSLLIFEALPEPYFRKGHLPGARRLDYLQAIEQVAALAIPRTAAIVLYCASATCQNSHIAAHALAGAGYTNVRVYAEGKQGWVESGRPLVRDDRPVSA